ncbi:hypothetical protein [Hymenobacter fodinae]|uniref:Uncharacterized protein n=1 Tax=Hymenobacter fodinae TaxID=2510796 RepID=A0A4Z0P9Z9_9BACT|nr:hypothetical protein [Hymenobacter fodinae]TGE08266.1 hypothetical protein EU556_11125 [Hymenobacter fodinae]
MDKALKQFADRLPIPESSNLAPIAGWLLKQQRPDLVGPLGEPIEDNRLYYVGSKVETVNHLRRLRKAFEQDGIGGVVKYLQPYEAFLAQTHEEVGILMQLPSVN